MKLLEERILRDGEVLGNDVLKVGSFLNQQMDVTLFRQMAETWKALFHGENVTKILTIEASGIGIAAITAEVFGCDAVFAKKSRTSNVSGDVYKAMVTSFTHGIVSEVIVPKPFLTGADRVLIIDDFLANGEALRGLISLVDQAGATLVGCGIAIEKAFQPGGKRLREKGIRIESLAKIRSMSDTDGIVFED